MSAEDGDHEGVNVDDGQPDATDNGMLLAERDTEEGLLVAACDADLIGETFEEGKISLTVNEEFYGGDPADAEEVVGSLRRAQVANIVGERVVAAAIDAGVIDAGTVLDVDGTRHAQLVRL